MSSLESLLHREAKTLCKGQTTRFWLSEMAIKTSSYFVDCKRDFNVYEFNGRLKRFNEDKHRRMSKYELANTERMVCWEKSKHGIEHVDVNGNGFIHDNERFCFPFSKVFWFESTTLYSFHSSLLWYVYLWVERY